MSKENVIPVFRVTANSGATWRSDEYHSLDAFLSNTQSIIGLMEMSLDGEKFYSMEQIEEAVKLLKWKEATKIELLKCAEGSVKDD